MINPKNFSKTIFLLIISVILFACSFKDNDINDNRKAKYELYFQNANKLGYIKIYDNFDIDAVKNISYNLPFSLGTRDMEISSNGNMYQAICKNVNWNTLLKKIYMVKGDAKIGEIETPDDCPSEMFMDGNILYVFYITWFKGTRPDGGLLTIIDTNTNKVIDNKRVFGTLDRRPKIYNDKIYLILNNANKLGYKEYTNKYMIEIDRETYEFKKLFDLENIIDFDIYEDHMYMIRAIQISRGKELFYLVKSDMEGNEITQKKIDYEVTSIEIQDDGIAYMYNQYVNSPFYIYDLKEDKLIKEIKDFGVVRNIEFIDNLIFVPGYKGNNILIIDRDNFEVVKEIELPDDVRLFDIKVKKAE